MARQSPLLSALAAAVLTLSGCGWEPLYADRQTGTAAAALRAIHVEPIAERIGERLEWSLRTALNPTGIPTNERYDLRTTLALARASLGIQSQGLATLGRLDTVATIRLVDLKSGEQLFEDTIHAQTAFNIVANGYATVVAQTDADRRTVEDLSREIVIRLSLYMQHHAAAAGQVLVSGDPAAGEESGPR